LIWRIEIEESAQKELSKLDPQVSKRVVRFLRERVAGLDDPRSIGEALKGSKLGEFWKYRVGDWRLVCKIEDKRIVIIVVRIGNRRGVPLTGAEPILLLLDVK
jgi:mRNA interferase RelE/StbE